jgi:hypothetical protein
LHPFYPDHERRFDPFIQGNGYQIQQNELNKEVPGYKIIDELLKNAYMNQVKSIRAFAQKIHQRRG